MLRSTFIHVPGIGQKIEQRLWASGVLSWWDFLERLSALRLSEQRKSEWESWVRRSVESWEQNRPEFFGSALPPREHWRCYPDFAGKVLFLDIETTGTVEDDYITMVGTYDGQSYRAYIHGFNLQQFEDDVLRYTVLVTFFGTGFDLPFLRRQFRFIQLPPLHIDLCYLLRRLGYKGGLKAVEERFGLSRSEQTKGLSGWDAVWLWQQYLKGSREALQVLVQYNQEDVMHLKPLLDFAYAEMKRRLWEGWTKCE